MQLKPLYSIFLLLQTLSGGLDVQPTGGLGLLAPQAGGIGRGDVSRGSVVVGGKGRPPLGRGKFLEMINGYNGNPEDFQRQLAAYKAELERKTELIRKKWLSTPGAQEKIKQLQGTERWKQLQAKREQAKKKMDQTFNELLNFDGTPEEFKLKLDDLKAKILLRRQRKQAALAKAAEQTS